MEIIPSEKYNLQRLQGYLEYELSAAFLLLFSFFWGLLMALAVIAALLFIPFMLKVLYEEGRFGWIAFFVIFVLVPAAVIFFIDTSLSTKMMLAYIPLAFFFFYCFTLKLSVRGWLSESSFRRII